MTVKVFKIEYKNQIDTKQAIKKAKKEALQFGKKFKIRLISVVLLSTSKEGNSYGFKATYYPHTK